MLQIRMGDLQLRLQAVDGGRDGSRHGVRQSSREDKPSPHPGTRQLFRKLQGQRTALTHVKHLR